MVLLKTVNDETIRWSKNEGTITVCKMIILLSVLIFFTCLIVEIRDILIRFSEDARLNLYLRAKLVYL